ncbi:hypothetical protein PIB30_033185 [Stylosanthes scabra]|uniref:Uncharacterized protein n=1 Tax=Stylosanthes scabra TaxID=79078 RepID=A0ABU6QCJ1_9FABA|nr:hypothetical protein [Stylosanthes scabra]
MALSRRPARFSRRPDSMQNKTISEEQLESLREAAACVFIDKQNSKEDKYQEVDIKVEVNIKKEEDDDNMKVETELTYEDTNYKGKGIVKKEEQYEKHINVNSFRVKQEPYI